MVVGLVSELLDNELLVASKNAGPRQNATAERLLGDGYREAPRLDRRREARIEYGVEMPLVAGGAGERDIERRAAPIASSCGRTAASSKPARMTR